MNNLEAPAAVEYRRMAARCRDMATRTSKPGNLLRRPKPLRQALQRSSRIQRPHPLTVNRAESWDSE
jgi:hypothetical protein